MKRLFLSLSCSFALLAFMANSLAAQEATTPSTLDKKVIVIQKTENADGTTTVKKKSFDKGQSAETYMEELNLDNPIESVQEVIIMTGDDATKESGEAETVIMIRKGSNKTEIKWDSKDGELPVLHFNDLLIENRKLGHDRSELALIGDNEPKPFLGIYPERHENGGVLVTDIVPGTGAADAGIRSGDIITSIDGLTLASRGGLSGTLSNYKPGDNISVTFLRDGQSMTATVTLSERKEQRHQVYNYNYNYNYNYDYNYKFERNPCDVFIGVTIGSYGQGEEGVGVDGIIPGWPAEAAGLQAGDRILSLDGVKVNTNNELVVERNKHKAGDYFKLEILRNGKVSTVKARFNVCEENATENPVETVQPTELPKVDMTLELEELNAYPNPTLGELNVKFRGEAAPTTITITDITGKTVYNESLPNFDGNYDRRVDVSSGTPGTLMVSIKQNGKVITKPVVLLNRA